MGCEAGSCLSLLSSLGVSFPLTPALSLGERVPRRPSLERSARLDLSQRGRWFTLSPRTGVRGNGMAEPIGVVLDFQASYRGVAGSMNTPDSVALKPDFFVSFTLTGPVTLHDR